MHQSFWMYGGKLNLYTLLNLHKTKPSMSQIQSRRQQKTKESLEQLSENELAIIDEKPIASDGDRSDHKSPKRQQIEKSKSYSFLKWMASVMDKYLLDPLIGLIPGGVGDSLNSICSLPFIYVSAVKVRSLPLTLAVIYNILVDILVGLIPFLGNFVDIFYRSYSKNLRLIIGFVEEDREIINKVNRQAGITMLLIVIVSLLIYLVVKFIVVLLQRFGSIF